MKRVLYFLGGGLVLVAVLVAVVLGRARPDYSQPREAVGDLVIFSTTDTAVFAPIIADFRKLHPAVHVRYELMDADPLYHRFLADISAGRPRADILLSTSMDLQAKLVNDGYAAPHISANGRAVPHWARWRDEAFGISFEPVVMVFNRRLMAGRAIPESRAELLADIRRDPDFWRGRIGAYDIARSGLGYLLASQDARLNSDAGMLVDSFGDADVFINENTATLLTRIEQGELAMGYNLLGSYAQRRAEAGANLAIVYPREYTLAVSRTALVPRNAPNPQAAHVFLEYLLSLRGQQVLASKSRLNAVRAEIDGPYRHLGVTGSQIGLLKPISLGPGLLVYLDDRKHDAMIESWTAAIEHRPAGGKP